jgi:hypothetical protein
VGGEKDILNARHRHRDSMATLEKAFGYKHPLEVRIPVSGRDDEA